jgi:hypothetical protein
MHETIQVGQRSRLGGGNAIVSALVSWKTSKARELHLSRERP